MTAPRDTFWLPRIEALARTGLPHQYQMLEESGRLERLRLAAAGERRTKEDLPGDYVFDDSDVYKWLEACAYVLAVAPNADLKRRAEELVALVASAQEEDGYLDSQFQVAEPEARWTRLAHSHEMYCAGHLIEAGIAWARNLGGGDLLRVGLNFAELLWTSFGPEGEPKIDGHPEIELALLRLADHTGDDRWRALAALFLDRRGARPSPFTEELADRPGDIMMKDGEYDGRYAQDHLPISEQNEIEGHAVRAAYLYAAAARLLRDRPDAARRAALERLWANLTERRMYVTGGIGSSARNEGFTADYDLPNRAAYAETCASCALVMWGDEMLRLTGDGAYADVVELALFNTVLAGISPEGDRFFYANPLESHGEHARVPWFPCPCCPSNAARTIARVTEWAVHPYVQAAHLHFPVAGEYRFGPIVLAIAGDYPRSGVWSVTLRAEREARFELALRIPGWANDVEIDAPDALGEAEYRSGYAVFDRVWRGETVLKIEWPMPPTWIAAHPAVLDDAGRLALQAGPTVYALVGSDAGITPQHLQVDYEAEVVAQGERLSVDALYEPTEPLGVYAPYEPKEPEETLARYVPYRDWANDGPTPMLVWARRI